MTGVGRRQVLYVGDHIYGDILRSKKALSWRTMLVIPELETELSILQRHPFDMEELKALRNVRARLEDQIDRLEWHLRHGQLLPPCCLLTTSLWWSVLMLLRGLGQSVGHVLITCAHEGSNFTAAACCGLGVSEQDCVARLLVETHMHPSVPWYCMYGSVFRRS